MPGVFSRCVGGLLTKNHTRLLELHVTRANFFRPMSSQTCNLGPVQHNPSPKKKKRRVDSDARPVPKTANPNMKANALKIFEAGIEAVRPNAMIKSAIEVDGDYLIVKDRQYRLSKNVYVVAFGKAVGGMVRATQELLGDHIVRGVASVPVGLEEFAKATNKDYLLPYDDGKIQVFEAAKNNLPDDRAQSAAVAIQGLAQQLNKCDICLALISGGGSALLSSPIPPITIEELHEVVATMTRAGATIQQINAVRKNIEILKGGGLARAAAPAQIIGLALSNVIGNNPHEVASGPLLPDSVPPETSMEILEMVYGGAYKERRIPDSVSCVLNGGGHMPDFDTKGLKVEPCVNNQLIGSNEKLTCATAELAEELGAISYVFANEIQGNVREVGVTFAKIAHFMCQIMANKRGNRNSDLTGNEIELIQRGIKKHMIKDLGKLAEKSMNTGQAVCIVGGSSTTSALTGFGAGGCNQEMALHCARAMHRDIFNNENLSANFDVTFLSCATSGRDGTSYAAGAVVDPATITRAVDQSIDPVQHLKNSDSHGFFKQLSCGEDQVVTGFTGTAVMDFHLLLIKPNLF